MGINLFRQITYSSEGKVTDLKRYLSAVPVVLLVILLSACGKYDSVDASGYMFEDALGREIVVKSCDRTAALLGSFAEIWMNAGGNVCAASDDAWTDFELTLPEDCVNLGGTHSPSLENLLAANPDFVLASASQSSNVKMKKALESAGVTVAYFDVDSFEDYLEMLRICTDITGRNDLFEENGIAVKEEIKRIKHGHSSLKIPEEEKKVLLLRVSSGAVKAKGSEETVLGEMLSELGYINIADNDKNLLENLSIEAMIKGNPYRIFVVTMGNDTNKAIANITRMIEENPAWNNLSAVREGRLHFMERRLFNIKPNARWAKAYEELCKVLCEK